MVAAYALVTRNASVWGLCPSCRRRPPRRSTRGCGRHWLADTVTPQLTHETSATEAYLDDLIALVAAVKIDAGLRKALAG